MVTRTWALALYSLGLFATVALGPALGGSAVWAQDVPATDATANKAGSAEVIVQAPRRHMPSYAIPRSDAFAVEVAKDEAWRRYRDSMPVEEACPPRPGPPRSDDCGVFAGLKDYPGLRSLAPQ